MNRITSYRLFIPNIILPCAIIFLLLFSVGNPGYAQEEASSLVISDRVFDFGLVFGPGFTTISNPLSKMKPGIRLGVFAEMRKRFGRVFLGTNLGVNLETRQIGFDRVDNITNLLHDIRVRSTELAMPLLIKPALNINFLTIHLFLGAQVTVKISSAITSANTGYTEQLVEQANGTGIDLVWGAGVFFDYLALQHVIFKPGIELTFSKGFFDYINPDQWGEGGSVFQVAILLRFYLVSLFPAENMKP